MLHDLSILLSGGTLAINIVTLVIIWTVVFHEKKEDKDKEDDK